MIVLNDTLGAVGGSHTLFLRMCRWYREKGFPVVFLCNNRDNEKIAGQLEKMGVSIFVIDTGKTKETYEILKRIDDGDIRVFNFWWNKYLDIEAVKRRYSIKIENTIYLIHPKCLIKGESYYRASGLLKTIKNGYKSILPKMCVNNAIISMDEINIEETESYYGIKLDPQPPIIRLPMEVEPVDKEKIIKNGYDNRIIMTSCRADFPYKGYVVGLIDDFVSLKKQYPDIKLVIVCDGDDVDVLKEKIANVPTRYKAAINLHGWMSYEELKQLMNDCMIYIGMGSSVLDSSLRYKPSAVIKFYTMECIGKDYTADNPYDLAAKEDVDASATMLIKRVLDMDFDEYKAFAEKSYEEISKIYGIDKVMNQFLRHHNVSQKSILGMKDQLLVSANNKINSIRFKNKEEKSSVKHLTKGINERSC